jgi:hypothetical protein
VRSGVGGDGEEDDELRTGRIRYMGHENFGYKMSKCAPAVGTREGWPHISQKKGKGKKEKGLHIVYFFQCL